MAIESGRRMKAREVAMLNNGALVKVKLDPRLDRKGHGTEHYRVSTRNGLKILIRREQPHKMMTIKDRPGYYYCRETI